MAGLSRSRVRWWALQGVLCAVLAGAMGAAAWVRQHRLASIRVKLEKPAAIEAAAVVASVPSGWTLRNDRPGQVLAEEEGGWRQLTIARHRSRYLLSPLQWLYRSGILDADVRVRVEAGHVGGWPGVFVQSRRSGGSERRASRLAAAATVLPSGDVVTIRLAAQGRPDASDEDLVRRVAESLQITGAVAPAPAAAEFLLEHVRLTAPEHFVTLPVEDPYRSGLRLVADDAEGWLAVELVPCFVVDGDGADAFAAMVAARDPGGAIGSVKKLDNGWMCRSTAGGRATITATYLLTQADGQALLAEFRGDAVGAARIDALWERISQGVRFSPQTDFAERLKRGAELVRKIREEPDSVIPAAGEEKWLWYDQSPASRQRWMTVAWRRSGPWVDGSRSWEPPQADVAPARWRLSRDLAYYLHEAPIEPGATQITRLELGRLSINVRREQGGRAFAAAAPEQFVPGVLIPAVLEKAEDKPIALRTEWSMLCDGAGVAGPLTLLIEPRKDLPRVRDNATTPMRCLGVSINGSGEIGRWYFDESGQVQYVDLSGGWRVQREK